MTYTGRVQTATAQEGNRTLRAADWLLSPRQTDDKKLNEREKAILGGICHGSVRTYKSMRGLRLSLVPGPASGNCLLQ